MEKLVDDNRTVCPKCAAMGHFRYCLGFTYLVTIEGKKRAKRRIEIPDTITCLQCDHKWSVKYE